MSALNPQSIDSTSVQRITDTLRTTSLFEGHSLIKKTEKPQLHFTNFDYAVGSVLLVAYVFFVWLYTSNRKRIDQIFKSFYINRTPAGREELLLGNRVSVFLFVLFVLVSSVYISLVSGYYGFNLNGKPFFYFIQIVSLISFVYGLKIFFVRFLGNIFQTQKAAIEYSKMIFLFCNVLGLVLFPIVICLAFIEDASPLVFIYTGFCVYILFVLIRLVRGVIIGFNNQRVSKFYLFLYLCTLEILPFFIVYKLLMNYINSIR